MTARDIVSSIVDGERVSMLYDAEKISAMKNTLNDQFEEFSVTVDIMSGTGHTKIQKSGRFRIRSKPLTHHRRS